MRDFPHGGVSVIRGGQPALPPNGGPPGAYGE
jgi:hypothetical protein